MIYPYEFLTIASTSHFYYRCLLACCKKRASILKGMRPHPLCMCITPTTSLSVTDMHTYKQMQSENASELDASC